MGEDCRLGEKAAALAGDLALVEAGLHTLDVVQLLLPDGARFQVAPTLQAFQRIAALVTSLAEPPR